MLKVAYETRELVGFGHNARGRAMARVPRKDYRRHCPYRKTERLQRENGGAVSNTASGHMAGYDNDSAGSAPVFFSGHVVIHPPMMPKT